MTDELANEGPLTEEERQLAEDYSEQLLDDFESELEAEFAAGNVREALITGQAWLLLSKKILVMYYGALADLVQKHGPAKNPTEMN